jgi:hypothetical protein
MGRAAKETKMPAPLQILSRWFRSRQTSNVRELLIAVNEACERWIKTLPSRLTKNKTKARFESIREIRENGLLVGHIIVSVDMSLTVTNDNYVQILETSLEERSSFVNVLFFGVKVPAMTENFIFNGGPPQIVCTTDGSPARDQLLLSKFQFVLRRFFPPGIHSIDATVTLHSSEGTTTQRNGTLWLEHPTDEALSRSARAQVKSPPQS